VIQADVAVNWQATDPEDPTCVRLTLSGQVRRHV
jgi:hypothetical protein